MAEIREAEALAPITEPNVPVALAQAHGCKTRYWRMVPGDAGLKSLGLLGKVLGGRGRRHRDLPEGRFGPFYERLST